MEFAITVVKHKCKPGEIWLSRIIASMFMSMGYGIGDEISKYFTCKNCFKWQCHNE